MLKDKVWLVYLVTNQCIRLYESALSVKQFSYANLFKPPAVEALEPH